VIRAYRPTDLEQLYEICLRTGDAGRDATHLVTDPHLYGHIWAAPYGLHEPEHAFVLTGDDDTARGYVLGALDSRAFEATLEAEYWPTLRERYPEGSGDGLDALLITLLHHPPVAHDEVVGEYPSHLHIDLLPEAQGAGFGRRMMDTLLEALQRDGSRGVHFGVSPKNERALAFYAHLGFATLHRGATNYTLGMKL
jgi:ribosomal protein S18 acetylase RimI-like enzyme